jgi:AcrR family transcriptional regulator
MPMAPPRKPGRPRDDSLAARRREEILDIAAQCFAQNGYANTDVQEVANILGVGKGTVYRYFPSKRELFLQAVDRGMERLRARVEADVADLQDPLAIFTRAIRSYLAFFESYPELTELFIQERAARSGQPLKIGISPCTFSTGRLISARGKICKNASSQPGGCDRCPSSA